MEQATKVNIGFNTPDTMHAEPGDPLTVGVRSTTNPHANERTINPSGMALDEANRGTITHIALLGPLLGGAAELPADATRLPTRAMLAAPFGYYDENQQLHSWIQGQEVTDEAEIRHLLERGARLKPLEWPAEQPGDGNQGGSAS